MPGAAGPSPRRAASKRSEARSPSAIAAATRASAAASAGVKSRLSSRRAMWTAPQARPRLTNAARSSNGMPAGASRSRYRALRSGRPRVVSLEDPDRHPPACEAREGVDVVAHVLVGDDRLAGRRERLHGEDARAEQLLRRIAGDQARLGIERVPTQRVAVDHTAQAIAGLSVELLARQRPTREDDDLVGQPVDLAPSAHHPPSIRHRALGIQSTARRPGSARKIPTAEGWWSTRLRGRLVGDDSTGRPEEGNARQPRRYTYGVAPATRPGCRSRRGFSPRSRR